MTQALLIAKFLSGFGIFFWAVYRIVSMLRGGLRGAATRISKTDFVLVFCLIILAVRAWGVDVYWVTSRSMQPTLDPGDVLLVVKRPLWHTTVQAGDIVVVHRDGLLVSELIKRVGGVSGDRLAIIGNRVESDGQVPLWESQRLSTSSSLQEPLDRTPLCVTVPDGEIYLLGDNRSNSVDSRAFGSLFENSVTGKAVFRLLPISRFGSL